MEEDCFAQKVIQNRIIEKNEKIIFQDYSDYLDDNYSDYSDDGGYGDSSGSWS